MTAFRHQVNNTCVHNCLRCEPMGWIYKDEGANIRERLFTCTARLSDHYCHVFNVSHKICGYCVRKDKG